MFVKFKTVALYLIIVLVFKKIYLDRFADRLYLCSLIYVTNDTKAKRAAIRRNGLNSRAKILSKLVALQYYE